MPWYLSPSGWPTHADSGDEEWDLQDRGYTPINEADVQPAIDAFNAGQPPAPEDVLTLAEAASAIGTPGNALYDAGRAAFVPKWQPSTAYAASQVVTAPDGGIVQAASAHTSATTYDTTKWRAATGMSGLATRGSVRNRRKLARYETALRDGLTHVVVIGNSIAHGVGSNDDATMLTGYVADYEQYAWPVQLRRALARSYGLLPTQGWMGVAPDWGFATLGGTAAATQTAGPWGVLSATRGAVNLVDTTATCTIPATKTGKFTELDVFYWGTAAGVSGGKDPTVKIDGVEVHTGTNVSNTGNLCVLTITGLTDAAHEIVLTNPGGTSSTNSIYAIGVLPRRSTGVTVSKIAAPGATVRQAVGVTASEVSGGAAWTAQQKQRQIDSIVLRGYSDLVVISLTANEVTQQLPLAEYQSEMQSLITAAVAGGACVLLMGDPAVYNEESGYTIKGSDYRAILQTLSDSNDHVAYADFNAAITPDRSRAIGLGIFPSNNPGTVHPMNEGHRRMADYMGREVLPPPSI